MQTTADSTSKAQTQTPAAPASRQTPWRQTLSNALIITRREVRDSFRDWRILAPLIILTFGFPFVATAVADQFFQFVTEYGGTDFEVIAERAVPFLLMIVGFFPISISLVIALETFVGEKERRSLEPLLSSPLTNTELYIGKTLAAMIPPLVASYGGMAFYSAILLIGPLAWTPQPMLVFQIFLLTTVQALVMVTGAVVVSSQTTSTRAANLLASFVIIPMTLIIQGESFIMFIAPDADSPYGIGSLWMIALGMLVVVVLFLRVGNTIFNREELLGRTIDEINLRNTLRLMWQHIRSSDEALSPAANLFQWYGAGMPMALRRLRIPLMITVGWFVLAFGFGVVIGTQEQYHLPLPTDTTTLDLTQSDTLNFFLDTSVQTRAVGMVVSQNLRVLALALLLGMFSFGVMALVVPPAVFTILGYLYINLMRVGFDMSIFYAGVFTHGIVEIPVIVLATAAAFRFGSVITRPPQGQTVGGAWMTALGDTVKVFFGLVVPGLVIAALLEAFVTPRVLLALLGG